jgi:hypothetical protein
MPGTVKDSYRSYLLRLVLLSAVLLAVYAAARYGAAFALRPEAFLFMLGFFALLSAGLHYLLLSLADKRPQQFINSFMGITGGKLFLLLITLMIYLGLNKTLDKVPFIIAFFFLYIIFTAFEVSSILKALRK